MLRQNLNIFQKNVFFLVRLFSYWLILKKYEKILKNLLSQKDRDKNLLKDLTLFLLFHQR